MTDHDLRVAQAIADSIDYYPWEDRAPHERTEYLKAARAARAEMDGVQVVPLEWATITPDFYEKAERFGMMYGVTRARDGNGWIADASPCWSSEHDTAKFDVRDLAYDWCEDHNRARILAAIEPAPVSVREAARVLLGIVERREWSHYPIEMPLTINGNGPAKVGRDAHCMTYEVWEADTLRSISDHNKLPAAIEAWLRAIAEEQDEP